MSFSVSTLTQVFRGTPLLLITRQDNCNLSTTNVYPSEAYHLKFEIIFNKFDLKREDCNFTCRCWWNISSDFYFWHFHYTGNSLNFEVDNFLAFDVPLSNVSHTTSLKNEVTVEFHQNDDAAVSLMELRFHIPGDINEETNPVQVTVWIELSLVYQGF